MPEHRLLIPITIQFAVRYILRTGLLQRLRDYTQPVILLNWDDAALTQEFEAAGAEVYPLPKAQVGEQFKRRQKHIDFWHQRTRLKSVSTRIDRRRLEAQRDIPLSRQDRLIRLAQRFYYETNFVGRPGAEKRLRVAHHQALWQDTNIQAFVDCYDRLRPDAVFSLTPFLLEEQLILHAAEKRGAPISSAIISFDNITTRGWMPVIADQYFLWNRYNEAELRRAYPETASSQVTIVGSPQFDFYRDPRYIWPEDRWRQALGLPPDRPVILFGAGFYRVVPHEEHWLAQLDRAIEQGEIPGQPVILFRSHPVDPIERWQPVLESARHVVRDDPWPTGQVLGRVNVEREHIEKLASTLHHSQIHINCSSTMTIDGAFFDRPQIGPAYDDRPGRRYDRVARDLYLREHYLPITQSGGLAVAYSREELVRAVRDGLENPGRLAAGRQRLIREICTYDDGQCTARVAQALRSFVKGCSK